MIQYCHFCHRAVFTDARSVGTVPDGTGKYTHYHLPCLYKAYPKERGYEALVKRLFGPKPNQN